MDTFPWLMPVITLQEYYQGGRIFSFLVTGVLGGLLISVIANWDMTRKEIL